MAKSRTRRPRARTKTLQQRLRAAADIISAGTDGWGIWLGSIVGTVVVPCAPLGIELLKNGHVKADNVVLTAAVLAAAFAVSAEHVVYRVVYVLLFLASLVLGAVTSPTATPGLDQYA